MTWTLTGLRRFLFGAVFVLGGCAAADEAADDAAQRDARPNVVLFMLDTLRQDFLGIYGFEREPAPNLAKLAEESVVFDRAFSTSSWTLPAVGSLFTSLYPTEHGAHLGVQMLHWEELATLSKRFRIPAERWRHLWNAAETRREVIDGLDDSVVTLAEMFGANGYSTFGFSANVHVSKRTNFRQGFDVFQGYKALAQGGDKLVTAERVAEVVGEHADAIRSAQPAFVYVHFLDPHFPYHERAPYFSGVEDEQENARQRYLSEIAFMDKWFGEIRAMLPGDRDTVTVVVSDHGEEFWDHGGKWHGFTLYNELNRVVFIIHAPGLGVEAARVGENVSLIDVYPTLAELLGLKAESTLAGTSLAPLLREPERAEGLREALRKRVLFAHRVELDGDYLGELWGAIRGNWKLVAGGRVEGGPFLYDHREDPGETVNVAAERPEIVLELETALAALQESESHRLNLSESEIDPLVREQLEALGYL